MTDRLSKIYSSKSRTFLAFCFSFIFGVGLFSFSDNTNIALYLYISIFVIIILLSFWWQNGLKKFLLFCCMFFVLGGLRYFFSIPADNPSHIRYYNGENKEVIGWVSEDPARKIDQTKYIVTVVSSHTGEALFGKISVALPIYPEYYYGDKLILNCSLQTPKDTADSSFVFSKYLARDGIYSICNLPKIRSVEAGAQGNFFKKLLLSFKNKTSAQVERLWPEPESSLMAGLLYGARSGLPQELLDSFSRVGITHIIAVSGFNITIIASILLSILIYIGFARQHAFWLAVVGIIIFVLFTGASSSVVRAGIMGVLVLIASQLGRLSRISNVLTLTAAFMLLLNPYVLVWDAGFQLSFLATLGLVFLSPIINEFRFFKGLEGFWAEIKEIFVSTLSAILATLPLILFQFGRLSLIAPLANILVLWIIPWLMLFGFVALICSLVFFLLGQVVAWMAIFGLKYVIILTKFMADFRWSAVDVSIPWWLMVGGYVAMVVLVIKFNKKS